MARAATSKDAEQALEWIANEGRTIRRCAIDLGCHYQSLSSLLCSDVYSVRAREARLLGAEYHADQALAALDAIADDATRAAVSRQIAKEQHHRKVASWLHPARFGDKIGVGGAEDLPPIKAASDAELDKKIAALMQKAGIGAL